MKSWKKRWKNQLDNVLPALRPDVLNAPIPAAEEPALPSGGAAVKGRLVGISAAAIAALLLCFAAVWLFVFARAASPVCVYAIEINPAVTVSTDAEGKVTGVMSLNADADVIIASAGEEELIGRDFSSFVTWYTDTAAMLGYLNVTENGTAVRIAAEGENAQTFLTEAQAALENYFIEGGIYAVVVGERVQAEEFCAVSGISGAKTASDFAKAIKESKTLFGDRQAEGLSVGQLQAMYESAVVEDTLYKLIEGYLDENVAKIERHADDTENLWSLYGRIMASPLNPAVYPRDYWTVKQYYADEPVSAEFSALMAEMEQALNAYESDYGVEITDVLSLQRASAVYANLSAKRLVELLKDFTKDKFKNYYDDICNILGAIGVDAPDLASLYAAPQTEEEYYSKTGEVRKAEYGYRKSAYASAYETPRTAIDDYGDYVKGIIEEYGSLSEYWKTVKGK